MPVLLVARLLTRPDFQERFSLRFANGFLLVAAKRIRYSFLSVSSNSPMREMTTAATAQLSSMLLFEVLCYFADLGFCVCRKLPHIQTI